VMVWSSLILRMRWIWANSLCRSRNSSPAGKAPSRKAHHTDIGILRALMWMIHQGRAEPGTNQRARHRDAPNPKTRGITVPCMANSRCRRKPARERAGSGSCRKPPDPPADGGQLRLFDSITGRRESCCCPPHFRSTEPYFRRSFNRLPRCCSETGTTHSWALDDAHRRAPSCGLQARRAATRGDARRRAPTRGEP
jgi:hypothetical protein